MKNLLENAIKTSGLTKEELASLGFTDGSLLEYGMVAVSKFITDMTKHPGGLPYLVGYAVLPFVGNTTWSDVWSCKWSKKTIRFDVDGKERVVRLRTFACPKKYKRDDGKKRVIIMSHGFNSVSTFMMRYYRNYMERGFDCIIFDQRGHKDSKKYFCTMGAQEAKDLAEIAKYVRKKYGKKAIIGIQGESYGSGTAYQALPETAKYTDFTVCDCGYSSMPELASWLQSAFFFFPQKKLGPLVDRLSDADGVRYSDMVPIDRIKDCPKDYPVLMIHGSIDFFVPTHMTKDLYKAKEGKKQMQIYKGAFHALSQTLYKQEYHDLVQGFLRENGVD